MRNQREIFFDRKYEAQVNAAAEAVAERAAGELGGGLGGDFGSADLGGGELGGDTQSEISPEDMISGPGAEDLGAEPEPEDTGPLLAAPPPPAKRDDKTGKRITTKSTEPQAKGHHYTAVKHGKGDGRNGRPQNYRVKGLSKPKTWHPGSMRLKSLGKGIYEENQATYSQEEKLLFESRREVTDLIAELANLEIKTNENEA